MGFRRAVYVRAKELLSQRRLEAQKQQELRHSNALLVCPEIFELEREIASYGAQVIKAVGMGADAKEYVNKLSVKSLAAQEKRKQLLEKAGLPQDYLETSYTCSVCKDTGFHEGCYCQCYMKLVKELARQELEEKAGISRYSFKSFDINLYPEERDSVLGVKQREHMSNVLSFCKSYAEDFSLKNRSILMYGATGLGKTHLSLAIASQVLDKGYSVYYGSAQSIMEKLEREHFSKDSSLVGEKEEILESDLLIIDDLGCEFSTQFTRAEIYNIINSRILTSRPTIISTNCSAGELEEKYSQRVTSRILGNYYPLAFCGKDIRQKKRRS